MPYPTLLRAYIPGLLLALLLTIIAKLLALVIPYIGAPALALFLGIILGNLWLKQPIWLRGTRFAESRLLEYAIVLLGGLITFTTLFELGVSGILFIVIQMGITLFAAYKIGQQLNFSRAISFLMASGNAVCGSSAIMATSPVVGATDEERGLVITIVNLMGTVLMFLMPILAWFIFGHDTLLTSALIGGTLQSVGQVVASASMVNEAVNEGAIIFKIIRIIFIIAVVILFGRLMQTEASPNSYSDSVNPSLSSNPKEALPSTPTKKPLWKTVPWYVYGFFFMCILSSVGLIPKVLVGPLATTSNWFEVTALSAIGLRLNFSLLKSSGRAFSHYALRLTIVQVVAALALIWLLFIVL